MIEFFKTSPVGKFCIHINEKYAIHFLPEKTCRFWGKEVDWIDGFIVSVGFGPLFFICWLKE
jgi:hypothetical protein